MKLFSDMKYKLNKLKNYSLFALISVNVFYIILLMQDSFPVRYYAFLLIITLVFISVFYNLLMILVKQSYQGKILRILKVYESLDEKQENTSVNQKTTIIKKTLKHRKKADLMNLFYKLERLDSPQKFAIIRIYKSNYAFIEQVVTKRKHLVDLRQVDAIIEA